MSSEFHHSPESPSTPSTAERSLNRCASFVGILLAAGSGVRFDPRGIEDKLRQALPEGKNVAVAAALNLLAAVPTVLAVVRPGAPALAAELGRLGCDVVVCEAAADGMASSLVHALSQTRGAAGWVIALADMPRVQPATITALIDAVCRGAEIAAPSYHGVRGNPVAFGPALLPDLLRLTGDEGARRLMQTYFVTEIMVEDAGVRLDVDTLDDLRRLLQ